MERNDSQERPTRVLLIEDDEDDYFLTKDLLRQLPRGRYVLEWVTSYDQGLETLCRHEHDVCLLDYRLEARTGLEMLEELRCRQCSVPVILLTGKGELEIDRRAMQSGAADYLDKSRLDATLLERSIRYAIRDKLYESDLEQKVRERTLELAHVNQQLRQEVAERRRAEEALREADRRKDEFLATLGHELRNPLTPIQNSLEILRLASPTPEVIARVRAMVERQMEHLMRLVDDLLDVSRVTRGKIRLVMERLDVREVIELAVEQARPLIREAGLKLERKPVNGPLMVNGDRVRLVQVLSNLLNNAAKFTERGGTVALSAARTGSQIEIRVCDTGIGIPSEVMGQLFELFSQVSKTLHRTAGGLGIGLALVRRLVELHGGTVEAFSEGLAQGAEFVIRLPAYSDAAASRGEG
jgi:signal transduction histidine kinase